MTITTITIDDVILLVAAFVPQCDKVFYIFQGKPFVLPSVREAEQKLVAANLDKEYAGIAGKFITSIFICVLHRFVFEECG